MLPKIFASCLLIAACFGLAVGTPLARGDDPKPKKVADKIKEVAGTAEFLRSLPKHFATLKAIDLPNRRVSLLIDGEKLPKVWPLTPDAEIKIAGWWGRLDQFAAGDRVWVWFKNDRKKQPVAVSMLADEWSEQDIHGGGVRLVSKTKNELVIKPAGGKERMLKLSKGQVQRGTSQAAPDTLKVGERVYFQTTQGTVRLILDAPAFENSRKAQQTILRKRWLDQGLPGTITFLHVFSGEMDFMLDHEAMRWGRSLKLGDKVTLQADPPITAIVKHVAPWRERTQLRLVVHSNDQADLVLGQRMLLRMPAPSAEVETSTSPPDLDRKRTRNERIEWFLASIYCTCGVGADTCTGHFYTLASCNPNGCGMPNMMREILAKKIDKNLTDKQIFEELLKEYGPSLTRPHLAP
jgi:hypothetical protein